MRGSDDDGGWWRDPLGDLFRGRKVILAGGVAAGWTPVVATVRELGATDVLVAATDGRGVGPLPDADLVVVDVPDDVTAFMARVRAGLDALRRPPREIVDAIEAFDPDRSAVLLGVFLNEATEMAGRPFLAHRRPEWVALEDKIKVDRLLDRAGIARAPSTVVPLAEAAAVRHRFDLGQGTVWAVDATQGFHGGAQGTRWVVDDADAERARRELCAFGETVRVMPFLEGVATSIHGIVLPDGVAALRPVELVTLRRERDLVYSGCATFWDPPEVVRDEMRDAARRLGELLRATVDFRGAFTLDGVATVEGFRTTELNPRFGAGINVMTRGLPDLPVLLILDLVVAGRRLDITAARLEELVVAAADGQRAGGTWNFHADLPLELVERGVVYDGERWRRRARRRRPPPPEPAVSPEPPSIRRAHRPVRASGRARRRSGPSSMPSWEPRSVRSSHRPTW